MAIFSAVLFMMTLASNEWIEFVFGADPDLGGGSLERLIKAFAAIIAIVAILIARIDWCRLQSARGAQDDA